jgi:4-amino-4-deoxy-L-arabinose transferase-like glycosyltransferase
VGVGDRDHRARCARISATVSDDGVTNIPSRGARSEHHDKRWSRALFIVVAAALIRFAFAAFIPIFPDEAYYWDWSRHLAAGYFDHPPAIALLIRLSGDASSIGVRFGPILSGFVAAATTIAIARRLGGGRAALRAATVITVMPLAAAGLILATPDSPLLAATALTLYSLLRALHEPLRSRSSFGWWIATGVALGAAFASKYTSIFLPVAVFIAVLIRPQLRARLREPGPYVACVVATVVFSPVLVWNAHHGWISFLYQVRHGLSAPQGSALVAAWKHEGDFFGGQAALASPILFVLLAIATARSLRRRAGDVQFIFGLVALLSFGFFIYSALRQRVEPNWPAPAYIPAIVLLAMTSSRRIARTWFNLGVGLAAAMSILIYAQALEPVLPLSPAKDPIARAFGWTDLALAADSTASSTTSATRTTTWLGGDRYQEASELAFNIPSHPTTFATNLAGRANQYDLWRKFPDVARAGDNLVLALDESSGPHSAVVALLPYFSAARRGDLVVLRRGTSAIGTRRLWVLLGWKAGWPAVR